MDYCHRGDAARPQRSVTLVDPALIEEDPDTYYLKEHYVGYPCVLVRLARVHPDALRNQATGAHRYVRAKMKKKPAARVARASARSARVR